MIGNSMAYKETGFTILEQGDLNRETLSLEVTSYLVSDPNGEVLGEFMTIRESEDFIERILDKN